MNPNPYRFKDYPSLDQDAPIQVKDIADAFKQNPQNAKAEYSEKRMYIKGIVTYAGPDMFGLPSLELSDSYNGANEALCVFNKQSSIANVQEGDEVIIQGNFIDCVPEYGPTFKKCEITERGFKE